MYHAGQSVPEGLLGGTCALQEQTAVLEVVTRAAGYCVRRRTLGAPRFLRRHAGRQDHRVDDAEDVPTAIPPIVTFSARRGRRLSPLSSGPWPRRPHIIIIAPLRSRLVPIRSSFLAPTLGFRTAAGSANNAKHRRDEIGHVNMRRGLAILFANTRLDTSFKCKDSRDKCSRVARNARRRSSSVVFI